MSACTQTRPWLRTPQSWRRCTAVPYPRQRSVQARITLQDEIPQSQENAVSQAVAALEAAFRVGGKRLKKGHVLWPGVKRLAVEIPIADESTAAQLGLARALVATFPRAAGPPTVIFGSQGAAEQARSTNAPYTALSVSECGGDGVTEEIEETLCGPLLLYGTSSEQAAECRRIVDELWTGRAVVVANAQWLRDSPPFEIEAFAESLDCVFFFLPVSFSGMLGGGQQAFLFRWAKSLDSTKWSFFLDEKGTVTRVGQMADKPSNDDMEAMVYNASAAKSPLAAGAKLFNKMTKGFRK